MDADGTCAWVSKCIGKIQRIMHSFIHAYIHANLWVQDKLPTKYHCNLWKPRKSIIPTSMAACIPAARNVNVNDLLSYYCNDILSSRLVAQSLATTTDSMVERTTEYLP